MTEITTITSPCVLLQMGTDSPRAFARDAAGPESGFSSQTKIMVPTTKEMTLGRKIALLKKLFPFFTTKDNTKEKIYGATKSMTSRRTMYRSVFPMIFPKLWSVKMEM